MKIIFIKISNIGFGRNREKCSIYNFNILIFVLYFLRTVLQVFSNLQKDKIPQKHETKHNLVFVSHEKHTHFVERARILTFHLFVCIPLCYLAQPQETFFIVSQQHNSDRHNYNKKKHILRSLFFLSFFLCKTLDQYRKKNNYYVVISLAIPNQHFPKINYLLR